MAELESGGAHIMLFGLTGDLKPGQTVELTLTFERAGEVTIAAEIHAPGSAPKSMNHDHGEERQADAHENVEIMIRRISAEGVGEIIGSIKLSPQHSGALLEPALAGLTPGPHAFHVHENPDCGPGVKDGQKVAGLAAGGHFDPEKGDEAQDHSGKDHSSHDHGSTSHLPAGDLPELIVAEDGTATQAIHVRNLTLPQMMGRAIMIHAHGEQPEDPAMAKGGGARIACGVIRE